MKNALTLLSFVAALTLTGCDPSSENSTAKEAKAQEVISAQSVAAVGLPAIRNFREKRLLKDIYELRDQAGLITYTYLVAENTGKLVYLGQSVGYGIPYATEYTNPQRVLAYNETSEHGNIALPQADPNGLFSPADAEGTWIMLKDPNSDDVKPVYIEPRVIVSPFKLPNTLLAN